MPTKQIIACKLCRQRFAIRTDQPDASKFKSTILKLAMHLQEAHPEEICKLVLAQFEDEL
jgi:hypothetical protein